MYHEGHFCCGACSDHSFGISDVESKGLLANHRYFERSRELNQRPVAWNSRRNINKIRTFDFQHVARIGIA